MKINEIEEGSSVSVWVKKENTSAELPSIVAKVFDEYILAECFMHDDSLVTFDAPGLSIEMMVVKPGEVPYNFKNVKVTLVEYEGKRYHCMSTGTVGVRLNRRNAFRVFIGENGSASIPGHKSVTVLVKDLSSTGIGFLVSGAGEDPFEIGGTVNVVFTDSSNGTTIDVSSRVVRVMETDNQTLYGCMFTKHYPQVEKYTASKQVRKGVNKKQPPKR